MSRQASPLWLAHLAMYADDRKVAVVQQAAQLPRPANGLDKDDHLETGISIA